MFQSTLIHRTLEIESAGKVEKQFTIMDLSFNYNYLAFGFYTFIEGIQLCMTTIHHYS